MRAFTLAADFAVAAFAARLDRVLAAGCFFAGERPEAVLLPDAFAGVAFDLAPVFVRDFDPAFDFGVFFAAISIHDQASVTCEHRTKPRR